MTLKESPSAVVAEQLVALQWPAVGAGFGVGCWLLHPEPAIDAETVPLIASDVTVPDVDALIVQALQLRAGKLIE